MPAKIWFITGTSRGFGREWAIAALDRGDQVAATARDTGTFRDYAAVREEAARQRAARASAPGDPAATRSAILEVVDASEPPLRMFLGRVPLGIAISDYDSRLATWRAWQPVSERAQGAPPA